VVGDEPFHAGKTTTDRLQVFLLQAQRISELEARIAELERTRRKRKPTSSTTENATGGQSLNTQFHHDHMTTLHTNADRQ